MTESYDIELVQRAQNGDVEAVGELFDRHHEPIFRFAWSRVGDRQVAEDLTGEVFTRMVRSLPDYRLEGVPFRAWLYRIARNLITDHHRKHSQYTSVPICQVESVLHPFNGGHHNPDTMIEEKLTIERVYRALEAIDTAQRDVVVLRFLVGLSLEEVAAAVDKTTAAAKSLQHRGLKSLRVALRAA